MSFIRKRKKRSRLMTLEPHDRRKFPVISTILSICFVISLASLTFWVSVLDARLRTVTTLQASVLASNVQFGEQCKGIKLELSRINDQLNTILPRLLSP